MQSKGVVKYSAKSENMSSLSKNGKPSIIHIPHRISNYTTTAYYVHVEIVYRNGIVYRLSNGSNSVNHLLPANTNKSLLYCFPSFLCLPGSPLFLFFFYFLSFFALPLFLSFPSPFLGTSTNVYLTGINKTETRKKERGKRKSCRMGNSTTSHLFMFVPVFSGEMKYAALTELLNKHAYNINTNAIFHIIIAIYLHNEKKLGFIMVRWCNKETVATISWRMGIYNPSTSIVKMWVRGFFSLSLCWARVYSIQRTIVKAIRCV